MDMYAKLFARITESSIMEEPMNVRYTFIMLLAISDPEGYVIGTDIAIARRINMALNEFRSCVKALGEPDAESNSEELDGRRVVPSEGERGYRVVNYGTYREIKDEGGRREYMRKYMRERRAKAVITSKQKLTHAEIAEPVPENVKEEATVDASARKTLKKRTVRVLLDRQPAPDDELTPYEDED